MSTTWTAALDQLLDEVPGLGWKFVGTATQSGQVVTTNDPEVNRGGSQANTRRFNGAFLYIPSESGDDQIHNILSHSVAESTGVATITTMDTYDSTTSDGTMYILAVHPDTLRALGNDALELEYTDFQVPLTSGPDDADMQADNTTSWPDTSNVTVTTQTTASEVAFGIRGKKAAYSDAGYSQSTLGSVNSQRGNVMVAGIWKSDVGTNSLTLVKADDTEITSIDNTEEIFVCGYRSVTPGAEQIRIRLEGSAASDEGDWNAAWYVREDQTLFKAPSWVDDRFKQMGLAYAKFHDTVTSDLYPYESMTLENLREGIDYRYISRKGDANPHQFEILSPGKAYLNRPMWIIGSRPYSDFSTFSSDSDSTDCPLQQLKERCKQLLGMRYGANFPGLEAEASRAIDNRAVLRQTEPPKQNYTVRRMMS